MMVRCYEEGGNPDEDAATYNLTTEFPSLDPGTAMLAAAREYAEFKGGDTYVVLIPADDEARALPGWRSDEDEPRHRMYIVETRVEWFAREVATFNPYARTA